MRVSKESQSVEPEDFGARVLDATGLLVGRHPELEELLDGKVRDDVLKIAEGFRKKFGVNVSLDAQKHRGLPAMLAKAVSGDYPGLVKHMGGTSMIAKRLATGMGMSEKTVDEIEKGALIHDLGKIDPKIRALVDFEGKLDQSGKDIVGWHPEMGARIAQLLSLDVSTVEMIRGHHKRFDGGGYVAQNDGEIGIQPSIVAVADALDAMVKKRPGREPKTIEYIVNTIRESAGSHFHPEVAEAFLKDPEAILRSTPVLGRMPT